ncbi:MAG TPA: hypothetical protein VEV83_21505 [Parafilimonas sp.]|nr:hypothetical protein [Parafilimonas sp.]
MFSTPKIIAAAATLLLAGAIITTLFFSKANNSLKEQLSTEKLNSEKLLSEKLELKKNVDRANKDIDQFKTDINILQGTNTRLDLLLAASRKSLSEKLDEINRLEQANADKKIIEKELADLRNMKKNYEGQITAMGSQLKTISSGDSALTEKNNALTEKIGMLEMQNRELAANNELLKIMAADNYLVDGARGKMDKPTLIARRTNKLVLSFVVPEDLSPNLRFNIIAPDGMVIDETDIHITTTLLTPEEDPKVIGTTKGGVKLGKSIRMEYNPRGKFSRGIYKIEVFNSENYMGSCQVRLV